MPRLRRPREPGPQIQRTEVSGVRTFWAETPGPLLATLMFRVGLADEQLPKRGLTHLVEHLAMPDHRRNQYAHNATVEQTRTFFWAQGAPDEVASFLNERASMLTELPLGRLAAERGILQAEEELRTRSAYRTVLIEYFGARGYGLDAYDQLGVRTATEDELAEWAARHFTAGNATLWLTGPPPADLRLDLPRGPLRPAPTPEPVAKILPAYRAWGSGGGLTAGALVRRSAAMNAAGSILADRIQHTLRYELGVSYSLSSDYDRWTAEHAFVHFWPDVVGGREAEALETIFRCADTLAAEGPTSEELQQVPARMRRSMMEPTETPSWLDTTAFDALLGATPQSAAEILAEVEALTPDHVADATRTLVSALLWVLPEDVPMPDGRAPRAPAVSDSQVEGRAFTRTRDRLGRRTGKETLVAADDGLTLLLESGPVTVHFDRTAALLRWENGARELIGEDGFVIWTDQPGTWARQDELVRWVDAHVPDDRHVDIPEPNQG